MVRRPSQTGAVELPVGLPVERLDGLPPLALAYVGDAVYELLARTRIMAVTGGQLRLDQLHRQVVELVRAGAQAAALRQILPQLSAEEAAVVRRARNARPHHPTPAGAPPHEYRCSSGLEALFGYLYLAGRWSRLQELAAQVGAALSGGPTGRSAATQRGESQP